MKKIIITESQYKRLFNEQGGYKKLVLAPPPAALTDTLSTAINYGIDIKKTADSEDNKVTWEDMGFDPKKLPNELKTKFPKYVPEIISGYHHKKHFNLDLLRVLSLVEKYSGLDVLITGGNDYFHQKIGDSYHKTGNAIDFVVNGSNGDEQQRIIEKAVLKIALKSEFSDKIAFINEFKYDTGGSGGHFHISLSDKGELNYYYFFDEGLRSEGDMNYKCCDKNPNLTFNGVGSDIKTIVMGGMKKEPIPEKVDAKPFKPIETPKPELQKIDIGEESKNIVDMYVGKKKSEIKKGIKAYEEYYTNIINGLNNLLNEF